MANHHCTGTATSNPSPPSPLCHALDQPVLHPHIPPGLAHTLPRQTPPTNLAHQLSPANCLPCYCFACSGHHPGEPTMDALLARALELRSELLPQHCSNLLLACAKLEHKWVSTWMCNCVAWPGTHVHASCMWPCPLTYVRTEWRMAPAWERESGATY